MSGPEIISIDQPAIRVMLLPKDTNGHGTIFGGVLLSYIDLAAAIEVRKHTVQEVVTVAMDAIKFRRPVYVGDVVSFYTELVRIGDTSIRVRVEVEADRASNPGELVRVTEAEATFVAILNGHKTPVVRRLNRA